MSISIPDLGGSTVAELREVKVNGLPGVGGYTLALALHFSARLLGADVKVRNVSIRLELGGNGQRMIGIAIPEGAPPIHISRFRSDFVVYFRVLITAAQIEEIERRRNGNDFNLSLWFFGEVEQENETETVSGKMEFPVRQQEWTDALMRMEYRHTLLFELPNISPESPVGEMIGKAQAAMHKGDYDQTVILCRQSIEKIESLLGDKQAASAAGRKYRESRDTREVMDVPERLLFLRESLKNVTHLAAHHSDTHCGFSREHAKAILGATIAMLGFYSCAVKSDELFHSQIAVE